jgi:tetratricopeptide (TPR) repeat protein
MSFRFTHIVSLLACRVALCSSLAAAFSPFAAQAQVLSPEARKHFAEARQAQDAGSLDKAVQEYAATIRLAPTFAGAYSNLGLVYYVEGDFKDSSIALSKSVHLDADIVGANLYLGIDYLKLSHPGKAVPFLQHAAQLDPSNKDAQSWLGTAYWEDGQTWTALEQLRKADKNFPDDPDILFVLGEAYRKAADQEMQAVLSSASGTAYVHQVFGDIYLDQHALAKAAGHYQRALQQSPNAPDIHFKLGEVALMSGQLDEAEAEYRKQLQLTPADAAAKARLAEVALLKDQVPSSLPLLDEALALSPLQTVHALNLPPSFATTSETLSDKMLGAFRAALPEVEKTPGGPAHDLALAIIAARLDQAESFQAAWTHFESAIPRQPPASDLRSRANQDFERQSFESAEAEIHTWLLTHPRDLEAQYLAARSHRLLSLGVLDRLLTAYPDSYRSHQLLAQTYEQRDEDDKAIVEYKKVEELVPTLPGIHYSLGHLLVKDGDLEQATVQLKEELRLNSDQPEANAEMGMALLAQDQAPAAVQFLTKAISLQPDLWTAHQELGKAYYLQKNYDGARRELTLALTDDPEGIAHYQLGLVYKALGQPDAAAREFASSRKIKSDRLAQVKIEMPDGSKE